MRKFKFFTPVVLLALGISLSSGAVNAKTYYAPETETEATTEATTADGSKKKEDKQKKEWKTDSNTGKKQYLIDDEPVKGWKKIKKKWYYFGPDTFLVTNAHIGIYEVNEKGVLTNPGTDKDFTPQPHGNIYNSSSTVSLKDGNENVIKVVNDINSLYNLFQTNKDLNPEDIRKIRYLYNSLSLAEKANVTNETYLAEMELYNEIVYDYATIYATTTDAVSQDGKSKVGNKYTFEITDNKPAISVIVRYTTDTNMDGIGDKPEITLLSPADINTELTEDTPQIRTSSINAALTWTDNFLQFDIASAENGYWTILTDINCTFTTQEYSGNKKILNPIPSEGETQTPTDSEEKQETEKSSNASFIISIIVLLATIGGFVGLMLYFKKHPMEGNSKKKKEEDRMIEKTSEEDLENLRQELQKMNEEFENEEYDNYTTTEQTDTQKTEKTEFSQEEIKESLEDYSVSYDIEEDNYDPFIKPDIPTNAQTEEPDNNEDEWYEEEE